ncbi:hypothetical protein ACM46_13715 [Chryseobacterium angstadtii]|uniref:Nucleotidyltransferase n=1 Tax=Chryseobacterium angstadtii TaxID=558151 RepID=A0A0J7I9C1_9FLAO|nr:hypothetical protein [Chryseobacterium angstadtii]KMQ63003.1 hypothetical protein ACM46_13715 [Chryseobacterium angstadtii]
MNKTLQDIINSIIALKDANPYLQKLTSDVSKNPFWRKIFEVVGFTIWNFQEACKLHLKEIETKIKEQKVPTLKWYRNEALRYQYGFKLLPESGDFSTLYEQNGVEVPATDEQVETSKVIKYVAVTKAPNSSKISMKIATESNGEIVPLADNVGMAFRSYIEEIQAAGDNIVIVNYKPDILRIKFVVCYNPGVLLADGRSILAIGTYPVEDAIKRFLKNLPFNGELSVQKLEAAILAVDGVTDLQNLIVESGWVEPGSNYPIVFQPIGISVIPKSGYFKIEDWTGIQYLNYQAE